MKEHFFMAMNNLKRMLLSLALETEDALKLAVEAVKNSDINLAKEIIEKDNFIDQEEIKIEEECLKILALYQVFASDLREVITILKVNNELERVGDFAANIAKTTIFLSKYEQTEFENFNFSVMVSKVSYMLNKSLDALTYHYGDLAQDIIKADDEIDKLHSDNYQIAFEAIKKNPAKADYYVNCLAISHALERIGDIATNICEDVIYLEYGKIVRHSHNIGEITNGK